MSDDGSNMGDKDEGPSIGVYEGDRNGDKQRHGRGKNTFPNGDVYEGQYVNGRRYGEGTYIWKAGHKYTGLLV
jgi:radial spoke head protein 1